MTEDYPPPHSANPARVSTLRKGYILGESRIHVRIYQTGIAIEMQLTRYRKDLVQQLSDAGFVRTEEQEPFMCVRRALWARLYADDAGIVSKSTEGQAKMMTVIGTVFEAAGHTVSEKGRDNVSTNNTEPDNPRTPPLVIEAAGQRYKQTAQIYIPRWHFPQKHWPLAQNRPTDPSHASMPQTVRPGLVCWDDRPS